MGLWMTLLNVASAQDVYGVNLYRSSPNPCTTLVAQFTHSSSVITDRFYVDLFRGRPAPPAFGEWGDLWFDIDRVGDDVYVDGTRLPRWTNPRDVSPGDEMWFLRDVGYVYHNIDSTSQTWTVKLYTQLYDGEWWDVIVNTDAILPETSYTNNWDEVATGCTD
ncbi:MAG: hypothetical protein ABMA64_34950 [Myxococcota bacterium]